MITVDLVNLGHVFLIGGSPDVGLLLPSSPVSGVLELAYIGS